jgi:L-alanine-DL-glutamate epimerase-like enolase superfamily enzyme
MLRIHQTPSAAHLLGTDTAELTPGMVADSLADFHETEPVFADHGLVHSGCLVRVTTDTGAEGWGQVPTCNADIACNLLHRKVAPHALGADALDFADLIDLIGERACKFPCACLRRATLGLDTALWDLRGKVEGKSVTALIGDTTGRLRIYGLSMRRDIDQRPGRSVAIVPHVARALGERTDKPVDGNSGFTPARAIGPGRIPSDNGISHFEEPCPGWEFDWTRQVRDALPTDITGGEQDCGISAWNSKISMHVVDVVQPDIPCLGGLCRTVQVARMAAAAGRPCTPHAANHGLVTPASMHLLWVIPNAGKYREYSIEGPSSRKWADGLFHERHFSLTDGRVAVTHAPGCAPPWRGSS